MIERFAFEGEGAPGSYVVGRFVAAGLEHVDDVACADAVITFYPYASALEDAYFDSEGLVKRVSEKTLLIDLSPSTPAFSRELSAVAAVSDLRFVEAPLAVADLFADVPLASPDALVCFAAGEEDDVACARGLLELIASRVVDAGGPGAGQLAKAQQTITLASQLMAYVEREELRRSIRRSALSVDPSRGAGAFGDAPEGASEGALGGALADALEGASGGALDSASGRVSESSSEGGRCSDELSTGLLLADVVAAMSAADDVELILPHLEAAMHMLELMAVIGGADRGVSSLSLLYRSEEEAAACGLDWTRAEGLFETRSAEEAEYGDFPDFDAFDEGGAGFGFPRGFGGYSSN